jgi:hypothetical protein
MYCIIVHILCLTCNVKKSIATVNHGHTPKFEFNSIFNNISVLSCNRVILNINTGAKLTSVLFIHGPNKDFLEH